ncbi:MAG: alpha/beta fold hydrolase [Parvularculaceae bacterium]|nr:alpha/beta fold hydrolase [Parvularculaceae bacterium]
MRRLKVLPQGLGLLSFALLTGGGPKMKRAILSAAAAAVFSCAFALAQSASVEDGGPAPTLEGDAAPDDEDVAGASADYFARDKFAVETIVCPFKGAIKYKPGEISCGLLAVPENREKSRSRTIKLHFVKLHARKPAKWDDKEKGEWKKRDDPIIYLTGGPGAQAVGYVKRLKDHGARDVRDLYILEQRGIGFSEDFCPKFGLFDPSVGNVSDFDAYQRAGLAQLENCFAAAKAAKVDLAAYNTIENARDVEALRRALGLAQWNVWGISYGSILGQAYIKQDPAGIRAVVLDAIVPIVPGAHFQRIGSHFQRDLDLLETACKENKTCARSFPDFQERFKAAIVKATDSPIEVDAIDAELFPAGKGWFFGDLVGGIPFTSLYEQDNYPTLPAFIDALSRTVEKADYRAWRILTAGGPGGGTQISQGMYNAIACNDGWWSQLHEAVAQDKAEHPELSVFLPSPELIDEIAALCKRYGMKPRPEEQFASVVTDLPTVIANGAMDPITPPPLAKAILPGFSNVTYVEFPYSGHGPTRSQKCGGEFLTKFFDAPNAKVDTACADKIKAPEFSGPLYRTKGLLKLAALAAEDEKKVAGPALWFGLPALVLLIGLVVYLLAPVARLINRSDTMPTLGARPLAFLTALLGATSVGGLGFAAYQTFEANELLLLGGLLGFGRWFAIAGVLSGIAGLGVLFLTVKARAQKALPIGTLTGLLATGASGAALAAFLLVNGFGPF